MRIGLVIHWFDPQRGGAEQWTFQLTQRLLAAGHEVHVVAQGFAAAAAGLPIVPHSLGKIGSRLEFAAAAERKLRTLALDVVHDMGGGWYADVFQSHDGSRLALWERKLASLPRLVRPLKRWMTKQLPRYREFRRLVARQFADPQQIVVAVSKMVAEDYQHYHGVPGEQIRLVYNGVDTERFSPASCRPYREAVRQKLAAREADVLLLFVGHDFQRKGLATALRAAGRLAAERQPVRLLVVGGRPRQRYLRLAQRCGLGDAVTFAGAQNDPLPYYAAADALVLPSFYDPFGLVVLEAAACGMPVVTSRFTGASELLSEGVEGYVLSDPADHEELAQRLQPLLEPALRRRMAEAARRLALRYTFARNCAELLAVYHEVASRRQATAQKACQKVLLPVR